MPGMKAGARKTRATIIKRHGRNFWEKIGSQGGKACSPTKGFGGNRDLAVRAGRIGGSKSRRRTAIEIAASKLTKEDLELAA